ncbi:hypothetical protein [Clostridium thermobutyricum]|nr:hypothetical protein [Clostridium thermobutyricum]
MIGRKEHNKNLANIQEIYKIKRLLEAGYSFSLRLLSNLTTKLV